MTKNISQRHARWMEDELKRLHRQDAERNNRWATAYPGGVNIASVTVGSDLAATLKTARLLGHAVVCVEDHGTVRFYGIKP